MIPIRPQTIRAPSGEELIVLTRAEFDALIAAVADQLEDADDAAVFDERTAALQNGQDARLPAEVSAAMLSDDSLLRALRAGKVSPGPTWLNARSWPRAILATSRPGANRDG